MHDRSQYSQDDLLNEFQKRREEWRARREERRNRWAHFGDPAFWGLDQESMRQMGMGGGCGSRTGRSSNGQSSAADSSEVADLKATVESMQRTIATLSERVQVLERLAVDDDAKLAAEIEKLRGAPDQ
ncbi:MAG: hypothetical protein Q8R02_21210 [Hyphomonadaceae bacterium]|nr:hypothetical protein [Hyphomonadaceae bacterium]